MSADAGLSELIDSVSTLLGPYPARKIVDGEVTSDACAILDAYTKANENKTVLLLLSAVLAGHRKSTIAGATTCILMCGFLALEALDLAEKTSESCQRITKHISHACEICLQVNSDPL